MSDPKTPRRARPAPPPGAGGPPVIPGPRPPARPPAPEPGRAGGAIAPGGPAAAGSSAASPGAAPELADGQRKLIRPALEARPPREANGGAPRRREAPPDATGAEEALLARAAGAGAAVTLRLETGETVEGRIEWVDRACLKIRRSGGGATLVMKHAVVSLATSASPRRA